MRRTAQRGFTLVELLVVIGIIATLAAVAIPAVGRFVAPARVAANDDELGKVQMAMDMYITQNPVSSGDLVAENDVPTRDFSSSDPELYPDYMRDALTACRYTWDTMGQVERAGCP